MNRFGSATIAAVLGAVGLVGCGAESDVQVASTSNAAQEALLHGDLHHRDYYYLLDVANNLLAQREHARLAVGSGKTPETRLYAQRVVDDRECMLEQLQDLANFKGTSLPVQLTVHQEYRADRLARHRRYSDFNFMYLDYTADNLVKSINYSNWEVQDGYDTDVRRFADALAERLSPDLRNADNLMAGRGLDNGGKAPAKGDVGQSQDQSQQDQGQDAKAPAKGEAADENQGQSQEQDQSQEQGQSQDQDQDQAQGQSQDQKAPGKGDDNFCPDFRTYLSPTKG